MGFALKRKTYVWLKKYVCENSIICTKNWYEMMIFHVYCMKNNNFDVNIFFYFCERDFYCVNCFVIMSPLEGDDRVVNL